MQKLKVENVFLRFSSKQTLAFESKLPVAQNFNFTVLEDFHRCHGNIDFSQNLNPKPTSIANFMLI